MSRLAAAVDLDGAAFKDHSTFKAGQREGCGDPFRNGVIQIPRPEFSTPCVEFPVGDGERAAGVFDKDGAVIPAPYVVVGVVEEFEVGGIGLRGVASGGDGRVGRAGGIDADGLETGDGSGDLGKFRPDDRIFRPAPVARICYRPGKPGCGLLGPLGGHGVTGGGGCHVVEAGFYRRGVQSETARF